MQINYILLTHTNPGQVKRLIDVLIDEDVNFYINVDLKSNIEPFQQALASIPNLTFVPENKRQVCNWGGNGIVKATVSVMEMIVKDKRTGYVVLLSGQDYPIKNKKQIKAFLTQNTGTEYISYFSLPSEKWEDGGLRRLTHHRIQFSPKKEDFILIPSIYDRKFFTFTALKKFIKAASRGRFNVLRLAFVKKRFPDDLKAYGGDTWWALTVETIAEILTYLNKHEEFYIYIQSCHTPDEIIFQSVVLELFKHKTQLIKESITYANWVNRSDSSPMLFDSKDLTFIKELPKNKLFARKFDIIHDPEILNLIDKGILGVSRGDP